MPQTPLSHVNLRAVQDGIPNAFIRDARDDPDITTLLDSYVRYEVTEDGWALRTATPAEVAAHYEASRPAHTQTPECDLSVTGITPLSQIGFDDRRGNRRRRFVSRTSQKTSVTRVSPRVRG